MNEEQREIISALVDGELDDAAAERAVDRLLEDEGLRRAWRDYSLVGDALRGSACGPVSARLLDGVRSAVAAEPVPISRARPRRETLRPLAGFALAASVAAVAIIGIRAIGPMPVTQTRAAMASPAVAMIPADVGMQARDVSAVAPSDAGVAVHKASATWIDAGPNVAARLNHYLINYNEYLAGGMRGMLPYARLVAHDRHY